MNEFGPADVIEIEDLPSAAIGLAIRVPTPGQSDVVQDGFGWLSVDTESGAFGVLPLAEGPGSDDGDGSDDPPDWTDGQTDGEGNASGADGQGDGGEGTTDSWTDGESDPGDDSGDDSEGGSDSGDGPIDPEDGGEAEEPIDRPNVEEDDSTDAVREPGAPALASGGDSGETAGPDPRTGSGSATDLDTTTAKRATASSGCEAGGPSAGAAWLGLTLIGVGFLARRSTGRLHDEGNAA